MNIEAIGAMWMYVSLFKLRKLPIFHVCKTSEHQMICTRYGDVDTFDTIYSGKFKYHADGTKELLFLPTQIKKLKEKTKTKEPKNSIANLFFGPGETANIQLHHKMMFLICST